LLPTGNQCQYGCSCHLTAAGKQRLQDLVHGIQAFMLGSVQDFQVLFYRRKFSSIFEQRVVGQSKTSGRIQVALIAIVCECARLVYQRIDNVTKVDQLFVTTEEPWHDLHTLTAIPQLNAILVNVYLQPQASILATD